MRIPNQLKESFQKTVTRCEHAFSSAAKNIKNFLGRRFHLMPASHLKSSSLFKKAVSEKNKTTSSEPNSYKISKVHNIRADCAAIVVLRSIAHLPELEAMIYRPLDKQKNETNAHYRDRCSVQAALCVLMQKMHQGIEIEGKEISLLRSRFRKVGIEEPRSKFRSLLEHCLPSVFYTTQDVFQLYRHLRNFFGQADYLLPTPACPNSKLFSPIEGEKLPSSHPLVTHLFVDASKPIDKLESIVESEDIKKALLNKSEVLIQVNCRRVDSEGNFSPAAFPVEESIRIQDHSKERSFDLKLIQCTEYDVEHKDFHSFVYLKKDGQWFLCDEDVVTPVSFEQVKNNASTNWMHLFYE